MKLAFVFLFIAVIFLAEPINSARVCTGKMTGCAANAQRVCVRVGGVNSKRCRRFLNPCTFHKADCLNTTNFTRVPLAKCSGFTGIGVGTCTAAATTTTTTTTTEATTTTTTEATSS